jgi:hypothetical protein
MNRHGNETVVQLDDYRRRSAVAASRATDSNRADALVRWGEIGRALTTDEIASATVVVESWRAGRTGG